MKTVFKTDEIAHIWVHRGASFGRCPGNLSFGGDAISSYATVIGRRITDRGRTAYVLDRYSFSNSTSKSQSHVLRAIPGDAKVFCVEVGELRQSLRFTGKTLAEWYEKESNAVATAEPSRYSRIRAEQYERATSLLEKSREVLAFFGYGTARLDIKLSARAAGEANAAETWAEYGRKLKETKARNDAKALKERTARNTAEALKFLGETRQPMFYREMLDRVAALELLPEEIRARVVEKGAKENAEYLRRWRENFPGLHPVPHDLPVMLRAEGDEMVTSKGARVPLTEAKRTYRFAMLARAKGWHKSGETHEIGGYQLDAVNEQGVVAGCHRVTWAEIEGFAKLQGWAV